MKNKQRTTNSKQRTYKAFTLIELVVAVALLAVVFAFAGAIFKVCINSYRTAGANAEIIQKMRAVTDQLNADFAGLRKDGEIFVVWMASLKDGFPPGEPNSYKRFDRIMFFADGDFQSYGDEPIRGNVARICYMLANKPDNPNPPIKPRDQKTQKCILARTQHILTSETGSLTPADTNLAPDDWYKWNNLKEYECDDMNTLDKWKNMSSLQKGNALSVITDVNVNISADPTVDKSVWGTQVDPADSNTIHNLFCEGVGEFKIQGCFWDNVNLIWRWVPEIDPDDNGDLTDSAFFLGSDRVPGVLYPYRAWLLPPTASYVQINGINYQNQLVDEAHFNDIPGLGRALKFTFTLYDSKGVFKEGRTFTHIVYIGN